MRFSEVIDQIGRAWRKPRTERIMTTRKKGEDLKKALTRAEAQAFRARWEMVNAAEQVELQATSFDRKLRQLAALMASVEPLGWTEALAAEEAEVRNRWNRLRALLHG